MPTKKWNALLGSWIIIYTNGQSDQLTNTRKSKPLTSVNAAKQQHNVH